VINVGSRDIKALEGENEYLRGVLQILLETPTKNNRYSIPRKELERINHQLTALESLARQLFEQNQILEHAVVQDIMAPNMPYLRPASSL
jgi:hypothetical protein